MCLVPLWNTGLWAIDTTVWLSQRRTRVVKETCNSVSNVEIQVSSVVLWARLLYSASVLEWAINCCFWDYQDVKLGTGKMAALSTSKKAFKDKGSTRVAGWKCNPWNKVPLKYRSMRFTTTQWEFNGLAITW